MTRWATVGDFVLGTAEAIRSSNQPVLAVLDPGVTRIERVTAVQEGEDVAIGVYMSFDRKEVANSTSSRFNQLPTMLIEVHARVDWDEDTPIWQLEDASFAKREELLLAIERTLLGNPVWVGSANRIRRFETQRSTQTGKGRPSSFAQLTIEPTFHAEFKTDPAFYDELTQVDVNTDIAPPDDTIDVEQRIPIPQVA